MQINSSKVFCHPQNNLLFWPFSKITNKPVGLPGAGRADLSKVSCLVPSCFSFFTLEDSWWSTSGWWLKILTPVFLNGGTPQCCSVSMHLSPVPYPSRHWLGSRAWERLPGEPVFDDLVSAGLAGGLLGQELLPCDPWVVRCGVAWGWEWDRGTLSHLDAPCGSQCGHCECHEIS